MRIEPPIELYPRRRNPLAAFFLFIVGAVFFAIAVYIVLLYIPVPQSSFILTSSEGAEVYRHETWQPLKPGDTLEAGDKIRAYKIGWADLSSTDISLKLIGGSEIRITKLYVWNRKPQIDLEKGYLYVFTKNSELKISAGALATNSFTWPLLSFFDVLISPESKAAVGLSPANGHARIYSVEKPLLVKTWIPKEENPLEEGKTLEIFMQPFSVKTTPIELVEAARLTESFKKISLLGKAVEIKQAAAPAPAEKTAEPAASAPPPPAAAPTVSKGDSLWNLDAPSLFKTKSSAAEWTQGQFQYEVPNPESIAGMIFKAGKEIDASQYKTLKINIDPAQGLGLPESLRIEIRSQDKILRVLTAKLKGSSEALLFPVRFNSPTPVTEISLLVTHTKAGTAQKGGFKISGLSFS